MDEESNDKLSEPAPAPEPATDLIAPDELPVAQAKAVLALISQPTIRQAADAAGVCERTLHRWMEDDPTFMAAMRRARRMSFAHAVSLAQQYTALAVNVLAKIMTDPMAPYAARGAAAATMLKFGRDGLSLDDLSERIEALERLKKKDLV